MKIPGFLKSKILKKILIIIAALLLSAFVFFFAFRNVFLHQVLNNKLEAFNHKYSAKLIIVESHFTGITGIDFNGIYLVPNNGDTLVKLGNVHVGLNFFHMIIGKANISYLRMNDCLLNIVSQKGKNNYSFLLKGEKENEKKGDKAEKSFSTTIDRISETLFSKIPDDALFQNIRINALLDSSDISVSIDSIAIYQHRFKSPVNITENDTTTSWIIEGLINKDSRTSGFSIHSAVSGTQFPFVKKRYGLTLMFDSLNIGLRNNSYLGELYKLSAYASAYGLVINHKKISTSDVVMPKAILECDFNIGKDFIELDSSSVFQYNKFFLNPYFLYQSGEYKKYTLKINNEFDAQDFFSSLPAGLFTNFENIQTEGRIKFSVDLYVDMEQPDSLDFSMELLGKDFKIKKYGETDFSKIAGPFIHTVYENGVEKASFLISPDNPDFTSFENISLPLKESIMITENGGTYYQTGFDVNSLRLAIIQDIKTKKFVRGGSTIEMQLVKNVFLTKNKTIARKVEELLIVWLIQSGNLCSHERMFEVYLNIAEWGPGVYGIGKASRFYFNKPPSALSVPESIFLASILPRPKLFKYSFDKNGNIDEEHYHSYFSAIASLLIDRGTIEPSDTINMLQRVKLRAESKMLIMKDTSYFDTDAIRMQDEELMKKEQPREPNRNRENHPDDNRRREPMRK